MEIIVRTETKTVFVSHRPTSTTSVKGNSPFEAINSRQDFFADLPDSCTETEHPIDENDDDFDAFNLTLFWDMFAGMNFLRGFGSDNIKKDDNVFPCKFNE